MTTQLANPNGRLVSSGWLTPVTPIKDYALIGNCETAALINPHGGIDWLCLPAFDAGSFFGALVDDEKGGSWTLQPTAPSRVERQYLGESAILQTRFVTDRGAVKVTDFFVVARKSNARFYDFTSLHSTSRLVRLVEPEEGGDSVFSPIKEMIAAEFRRLTEVTYLGAVHGTMTALKRMQPRDQGCIVQVGSALSYGSIPPTARRSMRCHSRTIRRPACSKVGACGRKNVWRARKRASDQPAWSATTRRVARSVTESRRF